MRLGNEVARRSFALEASRDCWSVAVSGASVETIKIELQNFNKNRRLPTLKQVYISAHSLSSTTLSGPPSILQAFLSTGPLRTTRKLPLPIYGAFHASHLPLLDSDLDEIVGDSPLLDRIVSTVDTVLVRPRALPHPSLRSLLHSAVREILQEPLDLDQDIQQLLARRQGHTGQVTLTSVGEARMSGLVKALSPTQVKRLGSRQLYQGTGANYVPPPDAGEAIAVVGMAGRFPGAENTDELWELLLAGSDEHRMIPMDRFDVKTHVDPTGKTKNTSLTPYGCFYDGVGDFDITLFKMSPREAAQTDPSQRLMLLTAYEALEMSGYYDNGDPDVRPKHGTFYGTAADDYRQANSSQDVDVNYITGGTRAFGPGRVSYYFGWEGPSMSIDAACSASAVAMHQAISSLKLKDCDVALAGGANLLTCSDMFAGLSRAKFVCTTGPCKTFDENADGYCRADGFATVVFKRLEDAIRDKDNVLGVIRAVETNHAGTAISLTHPEADTQCDLFRNVLSSAGMTVDDIDHIELHGTGTQAGDLAESTSVTQLLTRPRPKDRPLTISSVKPNIGHSEAASGITSLIKGLLMLKHKTIPRHIGIKTRLNPKLPDFDRLGVVIPSTNMPYPALNRDRTRRMLVNNFNATGGITAMLLEEHKLAAESTIVSTDGRGDAQPITISAASSQALYNSQARLLKYLEDNPDTNLSHLSYTLTARRLHHKHRFACMARSIKDLVRQLSAELRLQPNKNKVTDKPVFVFVFTGQTGILPRAKVLYDTDATFRYNVDRADRMCREMNLPSFIDVITNEDPWKRTGDYNPVQVQLALVALEISLAILLESWGVQPGTVIGHSLGEYAALCVANVLSLADVLWLVGNRGLLLEQLGDKHAYSMAVVSLPVKDVNRLLHGFPRCEIACINSPEQTVVSGPRDDLDYLTSRLTIDSPGVKVKVLDTPYGFHSQQMDAILPEFLEIASAIPFQKPTIPVASTCYGQIVDDEGPLNADYLCRQTREPVRFQDALLEIDSLIEAGSKAVWVELGPVSACLPMISATLGTKPSHLAAALDPSKDNWATIATTVTKCYTNNGSIRWDEYHREHLDALKLLQLPSYPFDLKRYWLQYDGDWMIRKNQAVPDLVPSLPPQPALESSTLHHLCSDITEKGMRKLTFATDLSSPLIYKHCQIHANGGTSVLPGSIFADMAMAAVVHLYKLTGENHAALELSSFELRSECSPTRTAALQTVLTRLPTDTNSFEITITSEAAGQTMVHAQCTITADDGSKNWLDEANNNAYLYQSRMDLMQLFMANGQSSRLTSSDVAHILGTHEASASSAIQEVLLNTGAREGVGRIMLAPTEGTFVCDPSWLEALVDLPSVVLSSCKPGGQYQCGSWGKMQCLVTPQPGQVYRAHTRMRPHGQNGAMTGHVRVLDEAGDAVAVIEGLVFHAVVDEDNHEDAVLAIAPAIIQVTPSAPPKAPAQQKLMSNRPAMSAKENPFPPGMMLETPGYTNSISPSFRRPWSSRSMSSADSSGTMAFTTDVQDGGLSRDLYTKSHNQTVILETEIPRKMVVDMPLMDKLALGVDFQQVIDVLASEIGVEPETLTDDTMLEDLGVDSIIQISAVARLEECLREPLPKGFLIKHNSVAKLREYFSLSAPAMDREMNQSGDTLVMVV